MFPPLCFLLQKNDFIVSRSLPSNSIGYKPGALDLKHLPSIWRHTTLVTLYQNCILQNSGHQKKPHHHQSFQQQNQTQPQKWVPPLLIPRMTTTWKPPTSQFSSPPIVSS